jgi:hypothetical protein
MMGLAYSRVRCARRGWHRCRYVENPPSELHAAVCIECAESGPISWACINLFREYEAEVNAA